MIGYYHFGASPGGMAPDSGSSMSVPKTPTTPTTPSPIVMPGAQTMAWNPTPTTTQTAPPPPCPEGQVRQANGTCIQAPQLVPARHDARQSDDSWQPLNPYPTPRSGKNGGSGLRSVAALSPSGVRRSSSSADDMLTFQHLGSGEAALTIDECRRALHAPTTVCADLINRAAAAGAPSGAYLLTRMALVGASNYVCSSVLSSEGIPPQFGGPLCSWAAKNLWKYGEAYFTWGGPSFVTLPAGGQENIYWRRCNSDRDLLPGEHLISRNGHYECVTNMAIGNFGNQMHLVYVPCQYLDDYGIKDACMDFDAVRRVPYRFINGTSNGAYQPGFYSKKNSAWPSEFDPKEGGSPWIPPLVPPETYKGQLKMMLPADAIQLPPVVPAGSIATKDPSTNNYRVAVPAGTLGADPYQELTQQYSSLPKMQNGDLTPVVTAKEFDNAINPPFYKRGLFWGIVTGATAVAAGGALAVHHWRHR